MRKLVVAEYVSLDGVMEDPGGVEKFEHGGWTVHDVVDEFRLLVYPVVLGGAKRLFKDGSSMTLKPTHARTFSSGVVLLSYRPEQVATS